MAKAHIAFGKVSKKIQAENPDLSTNMATIGNSCL
jgi:hypothetical protein